LKQESKPANKALKPITAPRALLRISFSFATYIYCKIIKEASISNVFIVTGKFVLVEYTA
jgi:hypothetical protein